METKDIIRFYDNFVPEQQDCGINDRVYSLYKRLLQYGLKSDSNILELGSGIGTMTFLLSQIIKSGQIEAVDISPESVLFSKKRIQKPNVSFFANDIVRHIPSIQSIDFITLFDVIEHVPMDQHDALFRNIANNCHEGTKVLINIPSPESVTYDMVNNPKALQIIDQPLPLKFILDTIENNNLVLVHFETYSIWVENDYQFFVVTKKKEFKEVTLSQKRNFFQKAIKRVERLYIQLRYRYN